MCTPLQIELLYNNENINIDTTQQASHFWCMRLLFVLFETLTSSFYTSSCKQGSNITQPQAGLQFQF